MMLIICIVKRSIKTIILLCRVQSDTIFNLKNGYMRYDIAMIFNIRTGISLHGPITSTCSNKLTLKHILKIHYDENEFLFNFQIVTL